MKQENRGYVGGVYRVCLGFGLAVGVTVGTSCLGLPERDKASSDERFAGGRPVPKGEDVLMLANGDPVGYRVMELRATDVAGKTTTTKMAVWYPTDDEQKSFEYDYGDNQVQTQVAVNGSVAPGRYPLVVFSHGATGSGLTSAFVTETLARQGFVVAAPDHSDETFAARIDPDDMPSKLGIAIRSLAYATKVRSKFLGDEARESRPEIAYRPAEIKAAIDLLVNASRDESSPFHNRIDADRIGVMGHSFGAWSAMAAAGAVPQFADSRVKAVALLSAAVDERLFSRQEIAGMKVPTMMLFGSTEVKQGRGNDREIYYQHLPGPKYMYEIEDVDHVAFSGGIRSEYKTLEEYLAKDPRRAAITRYVAAFMMAHLKDSDLGRRQLHLRGGKITHAIYEE
jgi:predicted dienelactone hydrolase